ncbi:hypothetical protein SmJEL517_g02621 [Synchytrium microbalum]|uniref:PWWP domain-containing protein n=1 Tax=Synchytrium microbalum TaxID=1806994 RepID=A0A507C6F4_9FUNG|nr:uncharacterized protein SmJEL517_g02621 [Synchytrium microbalum]TPX34928.1 hypothetical protein SmJEL517_g02621 [Synchytrium microbalum]
MADHDEESGTFDESAMDTGEAPEAPIEFNDQVDMLPPLPGPDVKRKLVWTRMKGFPWWPSLVMDAALEGALPLHIRKQKRGKDVTSCYHFGEAGDVNWYKANDMRDYEDYKPQVLAKKPKLKLWTEAFAQSERPDALTLFDKRWDIVPASNLKITIKPPSEKKPKKPKQDRRATTSVMEEDEDESGNNRRHSEPVKQPRKSRKRAEEVEDEPAEPPKKKKKIAEKAKKDEPEPAETAGEEEQHERMMKLRAKLQKFWQKLDRSEPLDDKDYSKADSALKAVENFHDDGRMPAVNLIKNTKIGKVIKYLSKSGDKVTGDKYEVIPRSVKLMEKWATFYTGDNDKADTKAPGDKPALSNDDKGKEAEAVAPAADAAPAPAADDGSDPTTSTAAPTPTIANGHAADYEEGDSAKSAASIS